MKEITRDCNNCVYSTRDGFCGKFECSGTVTVEDIKAEARQSAIDEFANWLVEQGILGNRCIADGEITDYGKVYAKKYKEQNK